MPGRIDLHLELGRPVAGRSARLDEGPFRILVLGDFSGRGARPRGPADDLAERPILRVDVDSFDEVMRRIAPVVAPGPAPGSGSELHVLALDDFHPDRLYATLPVFAALRDSRARLADPATFESEAARLLDASPEKTPPVAETSSGGLFEQLIGAPPEAAARPGRTAAAPVEELVRRLVRPHVSPVSGRSPAPYLAALDRSATELMRSILHDPSFRAVECAWRGLRRLVDVLDLDEDLQLWIADVDRTELAADALHSRDDPAASSLRRLLSPSRRRPGDEPWSLLVGLYEFQPTVADVELLARLGEVAMECGVGFLASAGPGLLGCRRLDERSDPREWSIDDPEFGRRWNELRRSPAARHIGLALPRVLLRQPYGKGSDPVEAFGFEELTAAADDDEYLWGHPALACAEIAARRFRDRDADSPVERPLDVDDLPACLRDRDGERRLVPCGEHFLSLAVGEEILRRGLIPILSYANRNAVRVGALRSIAE